jgi:cysteine synthase A
MSTRAWVAECVRQIEADFQRSADTHLIPVALPGFPGVDLYFKDESIHPSGSLKHRLARSLFLYALCNGWLREGAPVVESSSGSTAVSEAYFARLLGLPFIAVMPATVSEAKRRAIEFQGGRCHLVDDPTQVYAEAARLAREGGGHYLDQFTFAERATDWRGNNNIAESIFTQMARERHPVPTWLVCSAGTGGTLATLGRFVRYGRHATRVCGADAERSVFFDHYLSRDPQLTLDCGSRIEGIGRPRVEASFLPDVIDAMVKAGPSRGAQHGHEPAGGLGLRAAAGGAGAGGFDRDPAVRQRRALPRHLLRPPVVRTAGLGRARRRRGRGAGPGSGRAAADVARGRALGVNPRACDAARGLGGHLGIANFPSENDMLLRSLFALPALSLMVACAVPPQQVAAADDDESTKLTLTGSRIPHKVKGRVEGVKVISREEIADQLRHERRPKADS